MHLLVYVLYGLFILSCLVLVLAVLLQPGKSDAGALFSSSVSSTAFGPRGTATLLAKVTIGAAAMFMLIALILAIPALTGPRSALQNAPADATATPAATPAMPPAPAATPAVEASPTTSGAANTNSTTQSPGTKADVAVPAATPANAKASPAATTKK
jgi:preprotein translocase subunit SecG